MIEAVASGVRITLRFRQGSCSYACLDPKASDSQLYEVADALNSLQREGFRGVSRTAARRLAELG